MLLKTLVDSEPIRRHPSDRRHPHEARNRSEVELGMGVTLTGADDSFVFLTGWLKVGLDVRWYGSGGSVLTLPAGLALPPAESAPALPSSLPGLGGGEPQAQSRVPQAAGPAALPAALIWLGVRYALKRVAGYLARRALEEAQKPAQLPVTVPDPITVEGAEAEGVRLMKVEDHPAAKDLAIATKRGICTPERNHELGLDKTDKCKKEEMECRGITKPSGFDRAINNDGYVEEITRFVDGALEANLEKLDRWQECEEARIRHHYECFEGLNSVWAGNEEWDKAYRGHRQEMKEATLGIRNCVRHIVALPRQIIHARNYRPPE